MKKIILISIIFAIIFASCSTIEKENKFEEIQQSNISINNISILTTFYPVEEITKAIIKDTGKVQVLIPQGSNPHSFEPSTKQIVELSSANIFIIMESMFEDVENSIIKANPNLKIIDATHNINIIKSEDNHEEDNHEEDNHEEDNSKEHNHGDFDPHIWLSINNMILMTEEIEEQLSIIYPENSLIYKKNADEYIFKLNNLQKEFENTLSNCSYDLILTSHKAFGYIGEEYGFEQISVAGFSSEVEPTIQSIKNVVDKAREYNLSYIFVEEMLDKKVSQTIANDLGVDILTLSTVTNQDNPDYFTLQRNNLKNLKLGLSCN